MAGLATWRYLPIFIGAILVAAGIIAVIRQADEAAKQRARIHELIETSNRAAKLFAEAMATPTPTPLPLLNGHPIVITTVPVRVMIPRGEVIIPRGTTLKLISKQANAIYVEYDGYSVPIPLEAAQF